MSDGWYSTEETAAILGISRQSFHASYRKHAPAGAVRREGKGRRVLIHVPRLIAALIDRARAQEAERFGDDVALLAGDNTPQLERLRRLKADLLTMDYEERKRTHMSLHGMQSGMMHLATVLRQVNEQARLKFGNECGDLIEEGLDEFVSGLEKFYADLRGDSPAEASGDGEAVADAR